MLAPMLARMLAPMLAPMLLLDAAAAALLAPTDLPIPPPDVLAASGSTLATMAAWEGVVAPTLKRRGVLPDVPRVPDELTEAEKMERFIVPLAANSHIPLPSLDQLREQGAYVVGRRGRVSQFITADTATFRARAEVREISREWSAFYGVPIGIEKRVL